MFWIITIFAIIVFVIVASRFLGNVKQHGHALNIVHACYTFSKLTDADKEAVIAVASNILRRDMGSPSSRRRTLESLRDDQKYSLYALAMEELSIPPADPRYSWQYTSHPLATPPNLSSVVELFEKDYSTKLDLKL